MGQAQERPRSRIGEPQRELLKRFHAEHAELQRMLHALRARIRDAAAGSDSARVRREAESLLAELEQRLPQHFASEERAGFLSQAVNQAPRLARRADALRAECTLLAEGLASLSARVRRAGPETQRWRKLDIACRRFAEAFDDHEQRENQLIHEAWVEDIGAVD